MLPNSIPHHYVHGRPPDIQISIPGIQSLLNIGQNAQATSVQTVSLLPEIAAEYATAPGNGLIPSNGLQVAVPFSATQLASPLPVGLSISQQQSKLDEQKNEEKLRSKRLSNRKSARVSRARKKAIEEELTRTNEEMKLYAKVLDLLPDPTLSVDKSGRILYVSSACTRQLKASSQELLGDDLSNWLAPDFKEAIFKHIADLFSTNEQACLENPESVQKLWIRPQTIAKVKFLRKDGSNLQCSLSSNLRCVTDEKDEKKELPVEVILVFRPSRNQPSKMKKHKKISETSVKRMKHSPTLTEPKPEISQPIEPKQEHLKQNHDNSLLTSMGSIARNSDDVHSAVKSLFLLRNTYS
mmetsp:Transcript_35743/g.47170  ORF Transcript_35743/g.47170 Transcript_35743/m.47170 type:complete len:354 (+) Transcript_35743:105-1166(+)